jgi:hypothetical protein
MTGAVLIRSLLLLGMLLSCAVPKQQFTEEYGTVYDTTQIIKASSLDPNAVAEQFQSFVTGMCSTRKLARLTIGTSQKAIELALNANFPEGVAPRQVRTDFSSQEFAQCVCYDGNVFAAYRSRERVSQVASLPTSRLKLADGLQLAGFELHSSIPAVWLYAVGSVRSEAELLAITKRLSATLQMRVFVVVSETPMFDFVDGPLGDAFSSQPVTTSESRRRCLICDSAAACRLVEPPHL